MSKQNKLQELLIDSQRWFSSALSHLPEISCVPAVMSLLEFQLKLPTFLKKLKGLSIDVLDSWISEFSGSDVDSEGRK